MITLAMGRSVYVEMALNLARSFLRWNRGSGISFQLITDLPVKLPSDLSEITVRQTPTGRFGAGFSPKLWLDELAPAAQTLFIDADCLCFGPLLPVFDKFCGRAVGVIGAPQTNGEFFGDIPSLRRKLNLEWVPIFVGAIYYLEPGPVATAVFEQARRFEKEYDSLGLVRLRGVPNDEPLIGLSMARHALFPLADDGTIKSDAMHYLKFTRIDVLAGGVQVEQPIPGKPVPTRATPVLFHFNSHFTSDFQYRRECCRLEKVARNRWPHWLATSYARVRYVFPSLLQQKFKAAFRPLYRRLFGRRAVTVQAREI